MPSYDPTAVAATFVSEYYHTFCYKPKELPKLYSPEAEIRHAEGKDGMGKGAEVTNVLARLYPGENRGKIVISDFEVLPANSGSSTISFRTKGVFSPTDMELPEVEFTQMFEVNEWPEKTAKNEPCFYISSDIMSWGAAPSAAAAAPKAGPSPSLNAKKAEKSVPPPPTMATGDWAMETPPLFARKDNKEEISPMDKPLGAAAAPALDLNKEASPAKSVFSKPAEEPKKEEAPKAEEKPAPAAAPAKKSAWGAAAPAPAPKAEEPKVEEAPKAEEKPVEKAEEAPVEEEAPAAAPAAEETKDDVDLSKMSMLERIRYKQNIKEKPIPVKKEEEPKKEEKKSEKKAEEKKDGKPAADKKKEASGEKKGEKKASAKTEGKSDKAAASVVYYDLILKGLPKGTAVEELYALLDQHVTVQKPIKLEARPDKADSNTIRTFAFVVLNLKAGKHKTVDEALPVLKRAKLQLNGVNVIVDRVREKYEK